MINTKNKKNKPKKKLISMKKLSLILITTLLTCISFAQEQFKELKKGDTIPDYIFDKVIFHKENQLKLSDYRGGLLILDFWASWCAPCVASFPKLDSLDNAFGDQLTVLPVTYQKKDEVEKLFTRLPKLKEIRKPIIYEDQFLRFILPHQSLPHYVWISPEGTFLAVIGNEQMNYENIQKYLETGELPVEKIVNMVTIPEETPLDVNHAFYKVIMTDYQKGRKGQYKFFPEIEGGGSRILATNFSPILYFRMAFKDPLTGALIPDKRIIIDMADPISFTQELKGNEALRWREEYSKCLEIVFPPSLKGQEQDIFKEEVLKLFPHIKPTLEQVEGKVYALRLIKDNPDLISRGGESVAEFDFTGFSVTNTNIKWMLGNLSAKFLSYLGTPLVNKTGITDLIDLEIQANISDLTDLNRALREKGLELVEEIEMIYQMRISDRRE